MSLILRVASTVLAAAPGQRKYDKWLVAPVNTLKGVTPSVRKEHGQQIEPEEAAPTNNRDLKPKDLFVPKPDQVSVRNLAETGKDLSKALNKQIPKDKGYDTVNQLSQYLIETKGGGGTKPVT